MSFHFFASDFQSKKKKVKIILKVFKLLKKNQNQTEVGVVKRDLLRNYCNRGNKTSVQTQTQFQVQHA
jgi:hypothetical protein